MKLLWTFADWGLSVLHLGVVLGNLLLWLPRATRRAHLVLVAITAASWFGLGLLYGIGYCFLSDWHWQIKRLRGEVDVPGSFIHYCATRWLGVPIAPETTNLLTGVGFALAACLSIALNLRDWLRRRRADTGR